MTTQADYAAQFTSPPVEALTDVPAAKQGLIMGNTLQILRDPVGFNRANIDRFGEMFRVHFLGKWRVSVVSAEGLEYMLTDPDQVFSSYRGWETIRGMFPGGLMLRDFNDHRSHRRIMNAAFKKPAMDSYFDLMVPAIASLVSGWPVDKTFRFYPAVKDLTLRMGANVFMGLPVDAPETDDLNRGFAREVAASLALLRTRLPLTKYRKGLDARVRLTSRFAALIQDRRAGNGQDFFSQMCRATDEDGAGWSDQEIVDHFNFLMMAAHDTTSSALTAMIWALTENPDWQTRLSDEVAALGPGPFTADMLDRMPLTDLVFKEALRFVPPVPLLPRQAVKPFTLMGHDFPAGTHVTANVGGVLMSPRYFTDPDRFDPERFSPNRAEDRNHRFAWAPFGGGAHKCIGLHFSSMQVKIFTHALLSRYKIARATEGEVDWKRLPIPQPKGGLPVILSPRR